MKDYISLKDEDPNNGSDMLLSPGSYSAPKSIPRAEAPAGPTYGKTFTKQVTPTSIMDTLDALEDDDDDESIQESCVETGFKISFKQF